MSLSKSTRARVSNLEQVKKDAEALTKARLAGSTAFVPKPVKPQAPVAPEQK